MKKPEKYVDTDFVKETTFHKLVNSNKEMIKYLQTFIAIFTDFKRYALQALTSSNKANQYNHLRYTKPLHN